MASLSKQYGAEVDFFIGFVSQDDRPTFIFDIETRHVVFRNGALDTHILEDSDAPSLQAWVDSAAIDTSINVAGTTNLGAFANEEWLGRSLGRATLVAVFCSRMPRPRQQQSDESTRPSQKDGQGGQGQRLHNMRMGWLQPSDDPWMAFIRHYAFENTAIGPISSWSPRLRSTVQTLMANPEPRVLYWGSDLNLLYNEAAVPVIAAKHPSCLGNPLKQGWPLAFDQIVQSIEAVMHHGKAIQSRDVKFVLERHGPEETWHNFHQLPLTSAEGCFLGCMCEFSEVTSAFVQNNRSTIIDACIKAASVAKCISQLLSGVLAILAKDSLDVVFGLVYTRADETSHFRLGSSIGVPDIEPGIPPSPCLAEGFKSHVVVLKGDALPSELAISTPEQGVVNLAVVLPITDLTGRQVAYVVLGLNPMRPFDDATLSFVNSIADLYARSATFIFVPEEQRRNQEVTLELEVALLRAEKNHESISRMARDAPIGMYMLKPDGTPTFVNDVCLKLIGKERDQFFDENYGTEQGWAGFLIDEDQGLAQSVWSKIIKEKKGTQIEIRVKDPDNSGLRWLESTSFAEYDKLGNLISVQGWLVDVSSRKLSERLMAERLEEALETKRSSESFMDMVSHEIRNPLSSVLQLTDCMLTVLDPPGAKGRPLLSTEGFESMIDSAQTITLCASHMRNIIDEILTYSKLDSKLLVLSLESVQVPTVIRTALKMFELELANSNIQVSLEIQPTYSDLGVDFVQVDPSRFLQIIINLLTNAIKFTRDSRRRQIKIGVAASQSKPTGEEFGIEFIARQKSDGTKTGVANCSPLSSPQVQDWTAGQEVYLYVSIEDTGRGLTEDETKVLFQRFAQASPRTYKSYGGSGLGLFISKKLTELQDGQIGVKSKFGVGSTFAFYIKAKRAEPPKERVIQTAVTSSEALTRVSSLPHREGYPDVKIITQSSSCEASSISAKDMHVLVVEDNAINKKVLVQNLRRLGVVNVYTAENGLEALEFLSTTKFSQPLQQENIPLSLILLDVEMPVMDGLTCIKAIRQMEATGEISSHVPVIAITANARSEQLAIALEAGMDEVVTKPFRTPELLPRMEALVQRYLPQG